MSGRFKSFFCLVLAALAVCAVAYAANEFESFPVYQDAQRDKDLEYKLLESRMAGKSSPRKLDFIGTDIPEPEMPSEQTVYSRGAMIYIVNSPIDAVFKFYKQKLGADEARESYNAGRLQKGSSSLIKYKTVIHELIDTVDEDRASRNYGDVLVTVKMKRFLLQKNRTPLVKDEWPKEIYFEWSKMDDEGRNTEFYLRIIDDGVPKLWKGMTNNTRIEIEFVKFKSEDDIEETKPKK